MKKNYPSKKSKNLNDSFSSSFSSLPDSICDENGYLNEKDKEDLSKMTQVARETVLMDRIQKREGYLKAHYLEKELKRKSFIPSPPLSPLHLKKHDDEFQIKKKIQALDELANRRQIEKSRKKNEMRFPESQRVGSENKEKTKEKNPVKEEKMEINDLERIRLTKNFLEKIIPHSFFEKTVKGCFVKIRIFNEAEKILNYAIAQIIDVVEGPKPYKIENRETKKLLILRHVDRDKPFKISYISNRNFEQPEFGAWFTKMESNKVVFPSISFINEKVQDIKEALSYKFKDDELQDIILKKQDTDIKDLTSEIIYLESRLGKLDYDYFTTQNPQTLKEIKEITSKLKVLKDKNEKYIENQKKQKRKDFIDDPHKKRIVRNEKEEKSKKVKREEEEKQVTEVKSFEEKLNQCSSAKEYEELKERFLENFKRQFGFEEELLRLNDDESDLI